MNYMEASKFAESQVDNSYDRGLKKLLLEFVEAEDKALDLLSQAMLIYSASNRGEMDDYKESKEAFEKQMAALEEIRLKIRLYERYERDLKEDLEYSFSSHAHYINSVSDYSEVLPELRKEYEKSKACKCCRD